MEGGHYKDEIGAHMDKKNASAQNTQSTQVDIVMDKKEHRSKDTLMWWTVSTSR